MIGLIGMAAIAIWSAVVIYLCKRIPRWLGISRFPKAAQFLLFALLFVLPIADELIGRWQFKNLCERENVIHLSETWRDVKRAKHLDSKHINNLNGYLIRIDQQKEAYENIDTGEIFLYFNGFHTKGGFLMEKLGLGLGTLTSCWPKNKTNLLNQINIDKITGDEK